MRRLCTSPAEQYRLVLDCRQSGLSDTRWCEENGIQPSTFYNWVNCLRKKGCEKHQAVNGSLGLLYVQVSRKLLMNALRSGERGYILHILSCYLDIDIF